MGFKKVENVMNISIASGVLSASRGTAVMEKGRQPLGSAAAPG
jgi:hypothetical protein